MMIAGGFPLAPSKPTPTLAISSTISGLRWRCSSSSASSPSSLPSLKMDGGGKQKVVRLKAIEATPSSFREYGQVVGPSSDGAEYGPLDAQLELHRGTPRFYIMHLEDRALSFDRITHHASVTQCLGSVGGHPWYLGVARSSIVKTDLEGSKSEDIQEAVQDNNTDKSIKQALPGKILLSKSGHYYAPPAPEDVRVFRVEGPCFLKLHVGTWHAGPLFKEPSMDFYNLELSNTNVVDHTTHAFSKKDGLVFVIED